jgi:hypothetical protein
MAAGIQVPALPTVVLGGLPGPPRWASRLAALGLDVVCSGSSADDLKTARAARAAAPHKPFKALAADPASAAALAADGCLIIEGGGAGHGAYALSSADWAVAGVDGTIGAIEDVNDVARVVVRAARGLGAANIWVAATPGLDGHPVEVVERKLAALVEGAHQARLAIAKDQFDLT